MQADEQLSEAVKRLGDDVHFIRLLMTRMARDSFKKDLESVASTPERQEMWRLCDGTLGTDEIAKRVGVSVRSVQYFLQDAEKHGIMSFAKRGFPKRPDYFDEIPSDWKPFKKRAMQTEEASSPSEGGNPQ